MLLSNGDNLWGGSRDGRRGHWQLRLGVRGSLQERDGDKGREGWRGRDGDNTADDKAVRKQHSERRPR